MKKIIILCVAFILLFCSCGNDTTSDTDENTDIFVTVSADDSDLKNNFDVTLAKNAIWRFYTSRAIFLTTDNVIYSGYDENRNAHCFVVNESIQEANTDMDIPYIGSFYIRLVEDKNGEFYAAYGDDEQFIFHYDSE